MQKDFGAENESKVSKKLGESGAKIWQNLVESEAKMKQFGEL